MSGPWEELRRRITELEALGGVIGLLEWDQQVMMPSGGAAHRGAQMAALQGILHERLVDPRLGELVEAVREEAEREGDAVKAAAARNVGRRHRRARRIPSELVRAMAEATSAGFEAWIEARRARAWSVFEPALERIVGLLRETVAHHGPAEHPYDHLLEEFDPGSTTAELAPTFERLAREVGALADAFADRPGPEPLRVTVDRDGLLAVSRRIMEALGFRMEDGRLDVSEHPFTVGLGPRDVRLTTQPHTDDLLSALGGTIHETGHGLYEQGLPAELAGTSVMAAASFGLHESQSRFWENCIGRSRAFARWLAPLLREQWPGLDLDEERLFAAANRVERSLVRVRADEVTYNLHIVVRFELERRIVEGSLEVRDLPDAWDDLYERIVRVRPADPVDGVLQDVHWSSGLFGYFPSYTVGNLYAAGFLRAMERDLPDLWSHVERGEFAPVLKWLRERVHRRGHILDAPRIYEEATGGIDPVDALVGYLRERHGPLYGLDPG